MNKRAVTLCVLLTVFFCSCQSENNDVTNVIDQAVEQEQETETSVFESRDEPQTIIFDNVEKEQELSEKTTESRSLGNTDAKESCYFITEKEMSGEIYAIHDNIDISVIDVDKDNPYYTVFEGVLYDKEMKTLLLVPPSYDHVTFLIPDSVEIIGDWAFDRCQKIETVVMGSNVKEIGGHAFYSCKALREIRFSEGLEYVGSHAFDGCGMLEEILLPDSVLSEGHNYMTTWASHVFDRCSSLKRVRIPCDTVLACIENLSGRYEFENTFRGCISLEEFLISESAENVTVYNGALSSASLDAICKLAPKSGVETFTIPSQTAILGTYAFENCTDLKELIIEPYEEAQEHSVILTVTGAGDTWRRTIWIDGETTINGCSALEKLVVPSDVEIIDINVKDFPKLVIYAERGSSAAKYAEENAIPIRYTGE